MVTGTSMDLSSAVEEFAMVRDRVSSNLNIFHAICNTDVERQNVRKPCPPLSPRTSPQGAIECCRANLHLGAVE